MKTARTLNAVRPWLLVAGRVAIVAGLAWLVGSAVLAPVEPGGADSPRSVRTSPQCDDIIGYAGPNDCLITFDAAGRIVAVRLLSSGDTPEHAQAVTRDEAFFAQFAGRRREEIAALHEIDAVSGATLTSLAVAEAIVARLGGEPPSLRFPDPIELAEVRQLLPEAAELAACGTVLEARGAVIGRAVRTGPGSEDLIGYGGPSDALLAFDRNGRLAGWSLRASYDNERHVGWLREGGALGELIGRTAPELAALDLDRVEGVSGATMTSRAVAEGIARTAARMVAKSNARAAPAVRVRDLATAFAALLALVSTWSRAARGRAVRLVTRIVVIVWLGLLAGDMVTQGLLVGWARHGLPLAIAPGLVALAAVALLAPPLTGRQPYCHQLCPHGAAQELLHRTPWRWTPPARLARALRAVPLLLLALVALALVLGLSFDLASIEPFDAWMLPLCGWATVAIAVVGLGASCFVSMAYCRYGCPTGALLDFVRRRGRTDRFGPRDWFALGLLGLGVVLARLR